MMNFSSGDVTKPTATYVLVSLRCLALLIVLMYIAFWLWRCRKTFEEKKEKKRLKAVTLVRMISYVCNPTKYFTKKKNLYSVYILQILQKGLIEAMLFGGPGTTFPICSWATYLHIWVPQRNHGR